MKEIEDRWTISYVMSNVEFLDFLKNTTKKKCFFAPCGDFIVREPPPTYLYDPFGKTLSMEFAMLFPVIYNDSCVFVNGIPLNTNELPMPLDDFLGYPLPHSMIDPPNKNDEFLKEIIDLCDFGIISLNRFIPTFLTLQKRCLILSGTDYVDFSNYKFIDFYYYRDLIMPLEKAMHWSGEQLDDIVNILLTY